MGVKDLIIIFLACYAAHAPIQWKKSDLTAMAFMALAEKNGVDFLSKEAIEQMREYISSGKM